MLSPDQFFAVLSDEKRRRILVLLNRCDELCVCELTHVLDLPQPRVSRYLGQIRTANLVIVRKQGTWMHYRLHPELPRWACKILDELAHAPGVGAQYQADIIRRRSAQAKTE